MPSKFGTSGIGAIYNGVNNIVAVYKGTELCFSSGDASISLIVPFLERTISSVEGFLSNQITKIGNYAFYQNPNLSEITIPESVTSIGDYAFYECSSLKKINIPSGVTTIGSYCFTRCIYLPSLVIPEGVTSLNAGTFLGSTISSLTLPSTLTTVGLTAFSGTTIGNLTILAETPPTCADNNAPTVTGKVYIPKGTLEAYTTTAAWSYISADKYIEM